MSVVFSADDVCSSWAAQTDVGGGPIELSDMQLLDFGSGALEDEFDVHYGLLPPEETVLIRAYSDDSDDRMLAEIEPKFIVMFEPNMEFIRRIEVRSSSFPMAWRILPLTKPHCRYIEVRTLVSVFECII